LPYFVAPPRSEDDDQDDTTNAPGNKDSFVEEYGIDDEDEQVDDDPASLLHSTRFISSC
jgi:hypothetical protein